MKTDNGSMPAMPNPKQYGKRGGILNLNDISGAGLTKREHFAAMAMQAFASNRESMVLLASSRGDDICDAVALASIEFADALLKALEAGE